MTSPETIIIIGSGLAGYNVARELRKLNQDVELILIADDNADFYSKPMLSNALAKNKLVEDLPMANAEKMALDLNAKILTNTKVLKIDSENNLVITADNNSINYSKLVLAVGASPIKLSIEGNATANILSVNNLEDYAIFRERIKNKKKIAIIGAGLIGCEFANDLLLADFEVSVIDLADLPLNRLLPQQAGEYLKNTLSDKGVNWFLAKNIESINYENNLFTINLSGGLIIDADVVLSSVGLRANIKLAEEAGIKVNRGISVNRSLQTNVSNIFALGDCAEVEGLFLPFVMPLMNSARAVAKSLAGEITAVNYPAMPVVVKTPSCPIVVSPPAQDVAGEWLVEEDEHGVLARYQDAEGNLQGYALVGKAVENKQTLTKELPAVLP